MTSVNRSLLPSGKGEFAKKEYWESFFKKRGSKAFEWYGEYTSLVGILGRYVKQKDKIFMVGCGNSDLSVDLYDIHQCHDITNLDISSVVIRQMKEKHCSKGKRPGLRYILGDICNLDRDKLYSCDDVTQKKSQFTCVIDKGTLDAMHSEEEENSLSNVEAMFSEIESLLNIGGRYICITLAQEHIVAALMNFFAKKSPHWLTRVHMLSRDTVSSDSSDFPLPVFAFVFTKFNATDKFRPIFEVQQNELTNDKMIRLNSSQQLIDWIDQQQNIALMINSLREQSETRCSFLCASTNQIYCVCYVIQNPAPMNIMHNDTASGDSKPKRGKKKRPPQQDSRAPLIPYAVFISPVGSHDYPMFDSQSSRQELCVSASCERLFLVLLNPRVYHKSKEKIQDCLDSIAMQFSPAGLDTANFKIPYMTCGPTTYPLEEIESGNLSDLGPFLIEEGTTLGRSLIFPESHFQPIQLTNQPNCARDECLQVLISCISTGLPHINSVLYYGLPKFPECLINKNVSCYPGLNEEHSNETTETIRVIFDKYFNAGSLSVEFVTPPKSCDFLIYDPISIRADDYAKHFDESVLLGVMSSLSDKGVILLLLETTTLVAIQRVKDIFSQQNFCSFFEKSVKDTWLGDQDTSTCEFIIACKQHYKSAFLPQLLNALNQTTYENDINAEFVSKLKDNISC